MMEKFPENSIFTPEQLDRMAKDAKSLKRSEDIRSGDYVPDTGHGPEEFEELYNETIEKVPIQAVKSKPKLFVKTKKEGPRGWYRRSEEKLEKLNDRGPRFKA
jgi:hypothetical protein